MRTFRCLGTIGLSIVLLAGSALADTQQIAPGTAQQSAIAVDTGANGLCETTAVPDDIQGATVGFGTPYQKEVKCGPNKTAETTAGGDDTQLVAVGAACNTNVGVVDTGPDGIANTVETGDDTRSINLGQGAKNSVCVYAGTDGQAATTQAGDDVQVLAVGVPNANQPVALCGPNLIADTSANNTGSGDDVQVVAKNAACVAGDTVVDSGPDGISNTRAEGPDLVIKAGKPVKVTIRPNSPTGAKLIKVVVSNQEFGSTAPASRNYKLVVSNGSCPGGTVSQVDADASTDTLDASVSIDLGKSKKASFVVTFKFGDVTNSTSKIPFRCAVTAQAVVNESPYTTTDPDDASVTENNSTTIDLEVFDKNDL